MMVGQFRHLLLELFTIVVEAFEDVTPYTYGKRSMMYTTV